MDGATKYRCCKEMSPALRIMTFDDSIEHISCITQHGDFGPITQVGNPPPHIGTEVISMQDGRG